MPKPGTREGSAGKKNVVKTDLRSSGWRVAPCFHSPVPGALGHALCRSRAPLAPGHLLQSSQEQSPLLKPFIHNFSEPLISTRLFSGTELKNTAKRRENVVVAQTSRISHFAGPACADKPLSRQNSSPSFLTAGAHRFPASLLPVPAEETVLLRSGLSLCFFLPLVTEIRSP